MKARTHSNRTPTTAQEQLKRDIAEVYYGLESTINRRGRIPHAWTSTGLLTVAVVEIPIGGSIDVGRGETTLIGGSGQHVAVVDAEGRVQVTELRELTIDHGVTEGGHIELDTIDHLAHLCDLLGALQCHGSDISDNLADDVGRLISDLEQQIRDTAGQAFKPQ